MLQSQKSDFKRRQENERKMIIYLSPQMAELIYMIMKTPPPRNDGDVKLDFNPSKRRKEAIKPKMEEMLIDKVLDIVPNLRRMWICLSCCWRCIWNWNNCNVWSPIETCRESPKHFNSPFDAFM
jgi:hypothetical protein